MDNDELNNFFLEGGDELMNSQECPHCGYMLYLDGKLEWIDKRQNICKCSQCGEEVKI